MQNNEKRNILFLDVDGVLNNENMYYAKRGRDENFLVFNKEYFLRESLEVLKEIVDEYNFLVVLSSSWRYHWEDKADRLTIALKQALDEYGIEIYGITGNASKEVLKDRRGEEIKDWCIEYNGKIDKIIILDDDSDMGDLLNRLVHTNWRQGLRRYHKEILKSKMYE